MLQELQYTRQIAGENRRRWFTSSAMDLIVWLDARDAPLNFELCYDKCAQEKALRWSSAGITHCAVDSGEDSPGRHKASPVHFSSAGPVDTAAVRAQFAAESLGLPADIRDFVLRGLA